MIKRILRKYKLLHYLGFHNEDCKRRIFTTKNKHLCLRTGKKIII